MLDMLLPEICVERDPLNRVKNTVSKEFDIEARRDQDLVATASAELIQKKCVSK